MFRGLPARVRLMVTHVITPNYSLGAVAVCLDDADRALLVRSRHQRAWSLPGGLLKRREAPSDGVLRELREELGVSVGPSHLAARPQVVVDPRARQATVVFAVSLPRSPTADGVEVVELGWFAADALPPALLRGTRESLALYDFFDR